MQIPRQSNIYHNVLKCPRFTRRCFIVCLGWSGALFRAQSFFGSSALRRISVRDFDAKGDGTTVDTVAIQKAIDACSNLGGGTVQVPPGRYVTGTILLKSGVTLDLSSGATLLGSLNPADYRLLEPFVDGVGVDRGYALIGCIDARQVRVSGRGIIDGRGAALQAAGGNIPAAKPFLLRCLRSSGLVVEGVSLVNSSAWTFHISQCSKVRVSGVSIRSLGLANNDGIDIDSSQDVQVEACTIETGDDAICLKTTSVEPCKDITVMGCTLSTRCAAFKIGTESAGDFSGIRVRDCHVIEARLGAIKLLSVDGAHITDVLVENIRVDDADTPIFMRLGARGRTFQPDAVARPVGTLSGVVIRDVKVKQARRIGILLAGIPDHPIQNVSLQRIAMTMIGDTVTRIPPEPFDNPSAYPEVRMFGSDLPASGIYACHIRGLRMSQIAIQDIAGDARPHESFLDSQP